MKPLFHVASQFNNIKKFNICKYKPPQDIVHRVKTHGVTSTADLLWCGETSTLTIASADD